MRTYTSFACNPKLLLESHLLLKRKEGVEDENRYLGLVHHVPMLSCIYFKLCHTDLHVVIPDLDLSRMERGDDPRLGGVKSKPFDSWALGLEF